MSKFEKHQTKKTTMRMNGMTTKRTRTTKKMIKTGIRSDHGPIRAALSSAILGAYPVCQHPVQFWHLDIGETIVGRDKSEIKKARPTSWCTTRHRTPSVRFPS